MSEGEFTAGEVVVPVVPDARGFMKKLKKDLVPGARELGLDIGRELNTGIKEGLGDLFGPLKEQTRQQQTRAPRDGESVGGAFARGFRSKVEAALRSLPAAKVDADTSEAQLHIAALRKGLQDLSGKTVGIDIHAEQAQGELRAIIEELQRIDGDTATVDVRADVASALAELGVVEHEVQAVEGKSARPKIDADIAGALTKIAIVGAALAGLGATPTILSIGAAFGAGAGALGFAVAAVPALGRVTDAVNEAETATGGAAGATRSLAQEQAQAAQAALSLATAQDRVADANRAVKDAAVGIVSAQHEVKKAQDDVARAAVDGAARVQDAVRRTADAERQYTDAVRAERDAQEALNDARKEAARDLQDLDSRLKASRTDQKEAALNLTDAEEDLRKVQARPHTDEELQRAQIAYERAQERVDELALSVQRLAADKADADQKGVEGSDRVQAAQEQLASAGERVAAAQQSIAAAQADVARAQVEAADRVADAQDRVADAQKRLLDAQRKYSDSQRDAVRAEQALRVERLQQKAALEKVGGAAGGAATKMDALSKKEKDLAKHIQGFKKEYKEWQQSLEDDIFPPITKGLDIIETQLPRISPLVRTFGKSFLKLEDDAEKALTDPFWDEFLHDIDVAMPDAIEHLGHTAGNIFTGLAGILDAVLPHANDLTGAFESGTKKFADYGKGLKDNPDFKEFIDGVKEDGPKVLAIVENLAKFVGKVVGVGAGAGGDALDVIVDLSDTLADMDPEQIKAIALGAGAIYTALKIGQGVKITALLGLADLIVRLPPPVLYAIAGGLAAIVTALKAKDLVQDWQSLTGAIGGLGKKTEAETGKMSKGFSGVRGAVKDLGDSASGLAGLIAGTAAIGNDTSEKIDEIVASTSLGIQKSAGAAIKATQDVAAALNGFDSRISTFNSKTDIARGGLELKSAFKDAKKAIDEAGGSLDITSKMTDKQRDAAIHARDDFGGYITKVDDIATAQAKLSGKADDAKEAILRQLDPLFQLAGKSKDARDQIFLLAEKYGISRDEAIKAAGSTKGLRDELAKLKSPPPIKIGADTKEARAAFNKLISDMKSAAVAGVVIGISGAATTKKAAGGVEAYSAGGTRSTPPFVASRPTILVGEGKAKEYFIPTEHRYHDRAAALLGQAATDLGLQVTPVPVMAGSSAGALMYEGSGRNMAPAVSEEQMSAGRTGGRDAPMFNVEGDYVVAPQHDEHRIVQEMTWQLHSAG